MPGAVQHTRPVDDDAGDVPQPRGMAIGWNGDVDCRARSIGVGLADEPVSFAGGLMAERRLWTGPEYRRPQLCLAAGLTGEGRINTLLDALPPPVL